MRTRAAVLIILLVTAVAVLAQTSRQAAPARPTARPASTASTLPSRSTVDSFLRHTFGFNPSASWKLKSIKQSQAKGVAEVEFELNNAQSVSGPQTLTLHVLPDQRFAVVGALVPFPDGANGKGLPSQAAVINLLRSRFGESAVADWRVEEIRPSRSRGVAEVIASGRTPQGQQVARLYVPEGSRFALGGEMIAFGTDPFAANRTALAKGQGAARGPADAPVTIVEFSDLQCPACRAAQPVIDKLLLQNPDVRFVFLHFPLESVHPWAFRAAAYADCISRSKPVAVWPFIEAVYANQVEISPRNADERLGEIARELEVDTGTLGTCVEAPDTKGRIWASQGLGRELEITGTPTLYINGRRVASVTGTPFEMLQAMVDAARRESTTNARR